MSKETETTGQLATESLLKQVLAQLQKSPSGLDKLAPAYVKAWGQMGTGVKKDAHNPHHKSDYATLEAVLNVVKPALAANGLALLQCPGGMGDGKASLVNILMHESGQVIQIVAQCDVPGQTKKDGTVTPPNAQMMGSANSYLRRYSAGAIGGLASVDDDGEATIQVQAAPQDPPAKTTKAPKVEPPVGTTTAVGESELRDTRLDAGTEEALLVDIEKATSLGEEGSTTVGELRALKTRVLKMNKEKVHAAYVARGKALKAASKGKKEDK